MPFNQKLQKFNAKINHGLIAVFLFPLLFLFCPRYLKVVWGLGYKIEKI